MPHKRNLRKYCCWHGSRADVKLVLYQKHEEIFLIYSAFRALQWRDFSVLVDPILTRIAYQIFFLFQTAGARAAAAEWPHHRQQRDQQAEDEHQSCRQWSRQQRGARSPPWPHLSLASISQPQVTSFRHWQRQVTLVNNNDEETVQWRKYLSVILLMIIFIFVCIV